MNTTELLRRTAKVTAPLARPLAGRRFLPIWAVVHHVGRRSSRAYTLPVAITGSSTHLFIPVPFGEGTQWVQNVLAAGGCTVHWKGRDIAATEPALVGRAEASAAFNRLERPVIRAAGLDSFLRLRR
jgi:deazaflavin-dependent oxidoreductase (nitroreductase family)